MRRTRLESPRPSLLTQQSERGLQRRCVQSQRQCLPRALDPLVSRLAGSCCARLSEVGPSRRQDSLAPSRLGHCSETLRNGSRWRRNESRPSRMLTRSWLPALHHHHVPRPLHSAPSQARRVSHWARGRAVVRVSQRANPHSVKPVAPKSRTAPAPGQYRRRPLQHLLPHLILHWCAPLLSKGPEQHPLLICTKSTTLKLVRRHQNSVRSLNQRHSRRDRLGP
mmetsp:Transcript_35231/g.85772  ORF Transcript_35231/g.85772 Transcript_35231/m.85772 type:complete len:223 (+) Transcript_35231:2524-3192(+)